MTDLYHVSGEQGIRRFEPRAIKPGAELVVWAVDEEHLPNYLVPRDCPRVTFFAGVETTPEDAERFLMGAERVVAIESSWFERLLAARLVLYRLPSESFELKDRVAGYYVALCSVEAVEEVEVNNLPAELALRGVELRVLPSLWELRERVIHSTLGFSIIRMRNAAPPERGFGAYHPVSA